MARRQESLVMSFDESFVDNADAADRLLTQLSLEETARGVLQRHLSVRSAISTSSSFAQRQQQASEAIAEQDFRSIGKGTCGHIYEQPGSPMIIKKERPHPYGSDRNLANDFRVHQNVWSSFEGVSKALNVDIDVHIPTPGNHISAESPYFQPEILERFEPADRYPSDIIFMERIMPLPQSTRNAIIDLYCPARGRTAAKNSKSNSDALIRPILGRERESTRPKLFFSLRNFNMHLDQFLELELDETMKSLARGMARVLAIMHWDVKADARDVEFVLGSAPTFKEVQHPFSRDSNLKAYNFREREIHLWLLDFNQVNDMTMDDQGIEQAVDAFGENDRYYPRPGRGPEWLWDTFAKEYLELSSRIMALNGCAFKEGAEKFIEAVKAMQVEHDKGMAAAAKTGAWVEE